MHEEVALAPAPGLSVGEGDDVGGGEVEPRAVAEDSYEVETDDDAAGV